MGKAHVCKCTGPLNTTACEIDCPAFSDINTCVTDHGRFAKCLWDVTLSLFKRLQKHVMQLQPKYRATEIYTQTFTCVHADTTVIRTTATSRTYSGLG